MINAAAKATSNNRTSMGRMKNPIVTAKVRVMAATAVVFNRTVNPRPARQSRTIGPKTRWLASQLSKRSDDSENRKAASNTGPVVGISGRKRPMNPMPAINQPREISRRRPTRFWTLAIVGQSNRRLRLRRVGKKRTGGRPPVSAFSNRPLRLY